MYVHFLAMHIAHIVHYVWGENSVKIINNCTCIFVKNTTAVICMKCLSIANTQIEKKIIVLGT